MVIDIANRTNKEMIALHEELMIKNNDWTLSVLFYFKDDMVEKIIINSSGKLVAVVKNDVIHLAILNEQDNKTFCYVNNTSIENFNMIHESINSTIDQPDDTEKINQILDKIIITGIGSLTNEDKKILNKDN